MAAQNSEGPGISLSEGGTVGIDGGREDIDAIDSQIIEMIQERRRISQRIQQQRLGTGGPRTVLSREMVILDRYRGALGATGTALATEILHYCRGGAPESAPAATAESAGQSK